MTHHFIDNLYCDGYHLIIRGWICHIGTPSWELEKKIILHSDINNIEIIPDLDLRSDVTDAFMNDSKINYDHSGFELKILRQNLPNDYFNVKLEIKSKDINESVSLDQMIYV